MNKQKQKVHDKNAPYWAVMFIILWALGISTTLIDLGGFWQDYMLDVTGPAWNYILFRGLFIAQVNNAWTRFFTPNKTVIIFIVTCYLLETLQYYHIYDSTFDKLDLLAYVSMLIPLFILDVMQSRKEKLNNIK